MVYHMNGQDEIRNSEDIIDSREVIARIEYLESERGDLRARLDVAEETLAFFELAEDKSNKDAYDELTEARDEAREALEEWDGDYGDELKALQGLQKDAEGYADDWRHGCTLIRDSYFEDYARETAEEIGGVEMREARWPFTCIDWEKAASELQMDYTSVSFGGVDYWVR